MFSFKNVIDKVGRRLKPEEMEQVNENLETIKEFIDIRYNEATSRCGLIKYDYDLDEIRKKINYKVLCIQERNKALINSEIIKTIISIGYEIKEIKKSKGNFISLRTAQSELMEERQKLYNEIELFNFMVLEFEKKNKVGGMNNNYGENYIFRKYEIEKRKEKEEANKKISS